MITLLTNTYTEKEHEAIAEIAEEAVIMLDAIYCNKGDCARCEYRHICYDLHKLYDFAERKLKEKKTR